jgi:hypothetical protein
MSYFIFELVSDNILKREGVPIYRLLLSEEQMQSNLQFRGLCLRLVPVFQPLSLSLFCCTLCPAVPLTGTRRALCAMSVTWAVVLAFFPVCVTIASLTITFFCRLLRRDVTYPPASAGLIVRDNRRRTHRWRQVLGDPVKGWGRRCS